MIISQDTFNAKHYQILATLMRSLEGTQFGFLDQVLSTWFTWLHKISLMVNAVIVMLIFTFHFLTYFMVLSAIVPVSLQKLSLLAVILGLNITTWSCLNIKLIPVIGFTY